MEKVGAALNSFVERNGLVFLMGDVHAAKSEALEARCDGLTAKSGAVV